MLIRRFLLLASLLGLGFVSACTTTSHGDPRSTNSPTETSSNPGPQPSDSGEDELPFAGAPKVTNPLDTSRYEKDPCKSLTTAQAQSLSLPPTGKINDKVALSSACEWINSDTRGRIMISFLVDDPRGLSPEYAAKNRGAWEFFEELPKIEGYPAIARNNPDDRDIGRCTVVVGVADDMVFAVDLQLSQVNVGIEDPCEVAADVAGLALQTMKQGA
jgi:Protein of unknown function (DUF3558)